MWISYGAILIYRTAPLARVSGCAERTGLPPRTRGLSLREPLVRSTQPTPVREAQPLRGARSATPSGPALAQGGWVYAEVNTLTLTDPLQRISISLGRPSGGDPGV
jgi:hypothetical protein